jgi:hypothetical protein
MSPQAQQIGSNVGGMNVSLHRVEGVSRKGRITVSFIDRPGLDMLVGGLWTVPPRSENSI